MRLTSIFNGCLLAMSISACAGSQAAHEITVGRVALLTDDPVLALKHFEQAAALDPSNHSPPLQESAWTYIGRARYETKEYSLARQALDRALALNRDDAVAQLYFGLVNARAESNENSRKQIQAALQAIDERVDYIKRFTPAGEFWDPTGQLSAQFEASIKTFSATPRNWPDAIAQVERAALALEKEIDAAQRDESFQRRSGGSGSGDM